MTRLDEPLREDLQTAFPLDVPVLIAREREAKARVADAAHSAVRAFDRHLTSEDAQCPMASRSKPSDRLQWWRRDLWTAVPGRTWLVKYLAKAGLFSRPATQGNGCPPTARTADFPSDLPSERPALWGKLSENELHSIYAEGREEGTAAENRGATCDAQPAVLPRSHNPAPRQQDGNMRENSYFPFAAASSLESPDPSTSDGVSE